MPFSKGSFVKHGNRAFERENSIEILIESCDCSHQKILSKFQKVRSEESPIVRIVSGLMSIFGFFLLMQSNLTLFFAKLPSVSFIENEVGVLSKITMASLVGTMM